IEVDSGAAKALEAGGTSLLPVGVTAVSGDFVSGDAVEVLCEGRPVGKGLVAYSAADLEAVKGLKTDAVKTAMPGAPDEAIHRDRFVLA
ncbi:MAG: glutamate 5-kinase, partial [Solirubrobacterales bacterium]|nr:glutamate 5-kinase [Solirubrobacterales bacterium]